MLNWLLPEYDIYFVYQKYPGILFEYPALRFAQWLLSKLNQTILLYVHTKGAFNKSKSSFIVRDLWMNEFTHPRNKKYIKSILDNRTDISIPFRKGRCTWFNGMFISKRAFDLIPEIKVQKNRYFFEGGLFHRNNTRIKGIIKDHQSPYGIRSVVIKYLQFQKNKRRVNISNVKWS